MTDAMPPPMTDAMPPPMTDAEPPPPMTDAEPPPPMNDAGMMMMTEPPPAAGQPVGWWVWWRHVAVDGAGNASVLDEIREIDMQWFVGGRPETYPAGIDTSFCPAGISCAARGIEVVGMSANRWHRMTRVRTGSDEQVSSSLVFSPGVITVTREQRYSCAHPHDGSYAESRVDSREVRVDGEGNLWIGQGGDFWVYRPISQADAHNRYDSSYCGAARKGVAGCHCLCGSQNKLVDYACFY